jgi:2-polyprenyl-3-methyl-5-hydroxy-6-metoxy-1,4-benzoquinol methylase
MSSEVYFMTSHVSSIFSGAVSDRIVDLQARASQSEGTSNEFIYKKVAEELEKRNARGVLVDVGCGIGGFLSFVRNQFESYIGVDAVRYDEFPADANFAQVDLDSGTVPLRGEIADVVVAIETIEHLENPRAFMRALRYLVKPGGLVVVTTPNQLSFLSLLTLLVKHRFSAFQDVHYPAHLTALLEVDLIRIAKECGLSEICLAYTGHGRLVLTPWHYPKFLARLLPRFLSDNIVLICSTPRS